MESKDRNKNLIIIGNTGRIYKSAINNIRTGITSKLLVGYRNNNDKIFKHIILLDFDKYKLTDLIYHLKHFKMRMKPKLSNMYIFQTSKEHYSVICFTTLTWMKYKHLLLNLDVDPNFRYYTLRSKEATLRIVPKTEKKSTLKLVYTINKPHNYLEDTKLKESIFKLIGFENPYLYVNSR